MVLDGSDSRDDDGQIILYNWEQSLGNTITIENSDMSLANIEPLEIGTFIFTLTVTDDDNEVSSDEVTIEVVNNPDEFQPPKFFSPNNDGIADFWVIDNIDFVSECKLEVFNSGGQLVFEAQPYLNTWDGNNTNAGDYYYIFTCGSETFKSGSLRIIK